MKNVKFTANELLDSLNREFNQMEVNEIYKALLAYSIGLTEINEENEKVLDNAIEMYFDNDNMVSFINEDIYDYAEREIEDIH